jgi:hypothetical protein
MVKHGTCGKGYDSTSCAVHSRLVLPAAKEVSELKTRRDDPLNFSPLNPNKGDKMLSCPPFFAHLEVVSPL